MMEVGRLCVKIAGRDAGKKCVIVDIIDDKNVVVDGATRRRNCNVKHLEPLKDTIKISKGADHAAVAVEFKKLGIETFESKPRESKPRQRQIRAADRKKMAPKVEKKAPKKEVKPAAEEKPVEKEETDLEKAAMSEESSEAPDKKE